MNDGRGSGVQEVKAFEDLSAPGTQNLDFHDLKAFQVAAKQRSHTTECVIQIRKVEKTKRQRMPYTITAN